MTSKRMKSVKTLILVVLTLAMVFSCTSCFLKNVVTPVSDNTITLSGFASDNIYYLSGRAQDITFTVTVEGAPTSVKLCRQNDEIAEMKDDGSNGDVTANDGVYTCMYSETVNETELVKYNYSCNADGVKSESVEIHFFVPLNEASAEVAKESFEAVKSDIGTLESSYTTNSGYVPMEKHEELITQVKAMLDTEIENNTVLKYEEENNAVFIKFTSGLGTVYSPAVEGVDNVGSDVDMTVITAQPCFTDMGGNSFGSGFRGYPIPDGAGSLLGMVDAAGRKADNTFPNYSFYSSTNYDDSEVTLDAIKSFGSNQIILWHGHGYYGPIVKSCLVTGEQFDWNAWWTDWDYFSDCVTNRIANSWLSTGYESVIISSKFIEHYCGDMTNSFVYLAACSSGKSSELANAFTSKGAVVVANTDTIMRTYNVAMMYSTVDYMTQIDPDTRAYYTVGRALELAKAEYGADDSDRRYGGVGAYPVVFGSNDYRFATEVPSGYVSGKVCRASDRITAIKDATIEVSFNGNVYTTVTSDAEGNYRVELPQGEYSIKISKAGFISFNCDTYVSAERENYVETFLMIEGEENTNTKGVASGTIYNSLTGHGASDVTITVAKGWNNTTGETIKTVTTNDNGGYSVELPLGNYTLRLTKEGFANSSCNIVVQSTRTDNQDGMITPETFGDSYLITLTWDANPRDLDSHVKGTRTDERSFHVYYSDQNEYDGDELICSLDYDDTHSYGPEHITLTTLTDEPYYYYVHKYAGSGSLATSGAKVTVEQDNVLLAEFNVPTDQGDGNYWNVFAIVDGRIVVNNTITDRENVSY